MMNDANHMGNGSGEGNKQTGMMSDKQMAEHCRKQMNGMNPKDMKSSDKSKSK